MCYKVPRKFVSNFKNLALNCTTGFTQIELSVMIACSPKSIKTWNVLKIGSKEKRRAQSNYLLIRLFPHLQNNHLKYYALVFSHG
jgi:hypothetical protein